jgi:F0F1-type ATP synthase assembly protein I
VLVIDLPHARRLAYGLVLAQAAVTATAALAAAALADRRAALSALIGGGIATLGSLVMAGLVFGAGRADPQRVLGMFYLGEAVKLVLVIVLFVLALRWVDLAPLAMFVAFAATFLVYWIALIGALPALGGARRGA